MSTLLDIQKKLLPDLLEVMQKRFHILRHIRYMQPVGRRNLAVSLGLTERVLRSEVEFLHKQNLITIHSSGMSLTDEGTDTLEQLKCVMRELAGIDTLEKQLQERLKVKQVIVVSGNSDASPMVKDALGKEAAICMKKKISGENIIAVTGGTTMAAIADMLNPIPESKDLLFVPARGGLGEDVGNQANTIVAKMAEKMKASYRLLHVPDQLSDESYATMMKEPAIKEVMSLISAADIVLHGIGVASVMAKRRDTPEEVLRKIEDHFAVGEAFGYYFDEHGEIVHKVQTVGIQLEQITDAREIIAVAGGKSKAKAIRAYMNQIAPGHTTLITDEAAANELLKG